MVSSNKLLMRGVLHWLALTTRWWWRWRTDNIHNHKCACGWGWWWEWFLKIVWETQVSRQQKCKITFFSELLFCRTSLKIFACAWPLAIHAFDLCFKRIEKKMDRAPLPPHLHIMALFSYNNYPHLWFLLGRPGGQGGNISLWAIASKHNEEQSKSIIFISSDWSRQKDKFAKFPFAPISFLSLPHLYLLPLCQPSHLSKH